MSEPVAAAELLRACTANVARRHERHGDPRAANCVDENERARIARASGGTAITRLIDHPASGVRLLAAAHSLDVRETEAVAVLEFLAGGTRSRRAAPARSGRQARAPKRAGWGRRA